MKKILAITCLFLSAFSLNTFSQSNLTWVVKDKIEDNTFRTKKEFIIAIVGIANQKEVSEYCVKMKTNQEVESCESMGKDANGIYSIALKMKKPFDANYYIGWAQKLGVSYIEAKGQKKTPSEWAQAEKK